ncbi:hypothetical protein EK21DRAFT_43980, partial [Setomelanomma holmii]
RAWVLQEQVISRARLMYSGAQVYWECQSGRGCERFPEEGSVLSGLRGSPHIELFAVQGFKNPETLKESFHREWCLLIEGYTERRITKTSDRLIAVDGLAQAIQDRTACIYLAGLWREQLPLGLM